MSESRATPPWFERPFASLLRREYAAPMRYGTCACRPLSRCSRTSPRQIRCPGGSHRSSTRCEREPAPAKKGSNARVGAFGPCAGGALP